MKCIARLPRRERPLDDAARVPDPISRGRRPSLRQRTNAHRKVSAIATPVVSSRRERVRLLFRLHPNAKISAASVLSFLQHLGRQFHDSIFLLLDRFLAHRPRTVQYSIFIKKYNIPLFFRPKRRN